MRTEPGAPIWAEIEITQEPCTPEQYVADMIADEAQTMPALAWIQPEAGRTELRRTWAGCQGISCAQGHQPCRERCAEMACAAPDDEMSAGESWGAVLVALLGLAAVLSGLWTIWLSPLVE